MDRGVWRAAVHGIAKSQILLKQLITHAQLLLMDLNNYTVSFWDSAQTYQE